MSYADPGSFSRVLHSGHAVCLLVLQFRVNGVLGTLYEEAFCVKGLLHQVTHR